MQPGTLRYNKTVVKLSTASLEQDLVAALIRLETPLGPTWSHFNELRQPRIILSVVTDQVCFSL